MADQTILIIRHAEKPEDGGDAGVDVTGAADPKSLTPRGWQRAGAWAELFVPSLGRPGILPPPTAIFASAPAGHADIANGNGVSKSRRPLQTVAPLAARLGMQIDLRFVKGQENDLARTVAAAAGVVLVSWQHETIAAIGAALPENAAGIPARWPGSRYNVIYRFDRRDGTAPWSFRQIVPVMLRGDSPDPIG